MSRRSRSDPSLSLPPALLVGAVSMGRFGRPMFWRRCPRHPAHRVYIVRDAGAWRLASTCQCRQRDILGALGLPAGALRPERGTCVARYLYRDAVGAPLFEVVRYAPKRFVAPGPAGTMYRLPELIAASIETPAFWVEGEKDVETLRGLGFVAVTTSHGACNYRVGYAHYFAGRSVIILPDNDEPGEAYARTVMLSLRRAGADARIVHLPNLPPKQDVSYWLDHAGTKSRLLKLVGLPSHESADATGAGIRPGRVERAILALLRREQAVTTDRLPAEIMGLAGARGWNAHAQAVIWRYPDVPVAALKSARASISRALSRLQSEGALVRIGRRIRLPAGRPPMF